jgi:two-component system, sensor histidine kinase PdtaS
MNSGETPRHRLSDRLGFRLGLVLSMALLPVGLIAVLQSDKVLNEARARAEAALIGETLRAVLPGMRLLRLAQGGATTLAAILPQFTTRPAECDGVLRGMVVPGSIFVAADYFAPDGRVVCTSSEDRLPLPADRVTALANLPASNLVSLPGATPQDIPMVQAAVPVLDGTGGRSGVVFLSISPERLQQVAVTQQSDLALVIFNDQGSILSSNMPGDRLGAMLPADGDLLQLAERGETTFSGRARSGEDRAFSVVGLSDQGLFAIGSWPAQDPAISILPAAAFPALMWAVSLIAAFVAAELLVTRHIRDLRVAIMRFARGHRAATGLDMTGAPSEIRDTSDAFVQMTHMILRDEAELEHSLHQKEVLLREVHHRVKNNLQLIASIISMQMRETSSGEARQLMRAVQDRVISLATVHKDLYQTTDLTEIRADELLPEIVTQVITLAALAEGEIEVHSSFADLALTPDQAVPLALLLAEAVTHARNEVIADGGLPALSVTLDRDGPGHAILVVAHAIEASALVAPGESMRTGLGRLLIDAFAAQLGGMVRFSETRGSHRLELRFPVTEAVARRQAAAG